MCPQQDFGHCNNVTLIRKIVVSKSCLHKMKESSFLPLAGFFGLMKSNCRILIALVTIVKTNGVELLSEYPSGLSQLVFL